MEDYLNRLHLRNEENTDRVDYNCGGYAFETYSWYSPGDFSEDEDSVSGFLLNIMDSDLYYEVDIPELLFDFCIEGILKTFPTYKRISEEEARCLPLSTKIIAFRTYFEDFGDYDYHFKVRKNGVWSHKRGSSKIKECTLEKWSYIDCSYDSPTAYFIER